MGFERNLALLTAGIVAGWMVHRLLDPLVIVVQPRPHDDGPLPPPPPPPRPEPTKSGRPTFVEKLADLQDELIKINIGPDRWDFYAWDKRTETEPVQLRNAGTKNHRVLTLYKRKPDGTLDEEGMLVPIDRLTKLDDR
jgi:hypothetical protein